MSNRKVNPSFFQGNLCKLHMRLGSKLVILSLHQETMQRGDAFGHGLTHGRLLPGPAPLVHPRILKRKNRLRRACFTRYGWLDRRAS